MDDLTLEFGTAYPSRYENGCRIPSTDKLQVMCRKPNSGTTITITRPECAGHVVRTSDYRTLKKVFLGKPDGGRKAGRLKLSCSVRFNVVCTVHHVSMCR